jgi:hypothetical protein
MNMTLEQKVIALAARMASRTKERLISPRRTI